MKYRKKPIVIEATQWFANGDHPEDHVGEMVADPVFPGQTHVREEGEVVRYFRHPEIPGDAVHGELPNTQRPNCEATMDEHGWIDTLEGGHTVCPGDFVITGVEGERYPCEPGIFKKTYDPVSEDGDE